MGEAMRWWTLYRVIRNDCRGF